MYQYLSSFIYTPLRVRFFFCSFYLGVAIKIIGYKCAKSQNNANCCWAKGQVATAAAAGEGIAFN